MRRRLTVAIIALVVATVAVTTISSYVLIRRASISTAQQELAGEARAISSTFSGRAGITRAIFNRELAIVASAGNFTSVQFVLLAANGTISAPLKGGITTAPSPMNPK